VVKKNSKLKQVETPKMVKLDFGCGKNPKAGYEGVDILDFGQPHRVNLGADKWPWKDGTVEEAHSSHFIEHLTAAERIHFVNELYRVMAPSAKCYIAFPMWSSERAYGDLTHQWPPVSPFWFYYLSKEWRETQAPHNTFYTCDFGVTWGFSLHPDVATRNHEFQQEAVQFKINAAPDCGATLYRK
jgi:hypothetical protein